MLTQNEMVMEYSSSSSDEDEVMEAIGDLLDDSSDSNTSTDSETSKPRRKLHRIEHFVEKTVELYDEEEFKEHFRIKKTTCNFLVEFIKNGKVLPEHKDGRKKITPKKAVLMTVWYLSNQETFRQISDRSNVTKSSAHRVIEKIINYLVRKSKTFIKWPNEDEKKQIRRGFKDMQNIANVLGAIDGCHILIKRPSKDPHVYCNRNSDYSILLQGVCDHNKRFTDVFCGETGSIHDARLLKKSSLYEKGINGFLGNDFLLGDSAYPCLNWLIPPFKDNGNLTRRQKSFNYRHSASRIVIEHAFGLLKSRFRKLKFFENNNIIFIVKCVVAATTLHNICIDFDDEIEYQVEETQEEFDESYVTHVSGITPSTSRRDMILSQMFPA